MDTAMFKQIIAEFHDFVSQHHQITMNRWISMLDDCCSEIKTAGNSNRLQILEPCTPPPSKKPRKENKRRKSLKSAGLGEVMNEEIWKEFPEDLFEAVIARLPVATFFQFRLVCRKWSLLLNSQSFSQHCAEVQRANPWFYATTHENMNSGCMYDPFLKKWHRPTISSLPAKSFVLPVASAGGLVCFLDIGLRNFYVCNPLTHSCKELPARSFRVWSRIAVGMISKGNAPSRGYQILWVGCNGEYEIFDSGKSSWTRPGTISSNVKLPLLLNFRSQAISINDTLYFLRHDPEGIVSYNMATGTWKEYVIPSPQYLVEYALAECRGRIMLMGLLRKNAATCVCIWELQKMTLLWKEVDRMPNIWCLEFYGKLVKMTCLGNKDLLMLSLRSGQMHRVVSYDARSREWLKVPSTFRGRRSKWIACGTAFYPCPTAKP